MEKEFFQSRDRNEVRAMLEDLRNAGVDGCVFPATLDIGIETSASLRAVGLRVARNDGARLRIEGPSLTDRRGQRFRVISLSTSNTLSEPQLSLSQRAEPTSSPSSILRELRHIAGPMIQTQSAPEQFVIATSTAADEFAVRKALQSHTPPAAIEAEIASLRVATLSAVAAAGAHVAVRQSELQMSSATSPSSAALKTVRGILETIAAHPAFRYGNLVPLLSEDGDRVLVYGQVLGGHAILAAINYAEHPRALEVPLDRLVAKGCPLGVTIKRRHTVPGMSLSDIVVTTGTATLNMLPHSVALFATDTP